MVRKKYKTKYGKFKRGTISKLSKLFNLPKDQLAGRLSGSRKVSKEHAKILTEKLAEIGIDVPKSYWSGESRGKLRTLIKQWYRESK